MSRLISTCVLGLSLLSATLSAQSRPDFSGRWTPVNPTGDQQVLLITQDATSLIAERTEGALTERVRFTFAGATQQDVSHANVEVTTTASWQGSTLNATSTSRSKAEGTILSVRDDSWSLDGEGRLVIEVTTRRPSGQSSATKSVYRRVVNP